MFREGQQIGGYTLINVLGSGGFGEVWLAERRTALVTKKVAIKLPHAGQVELETIRQEASLWEQASGHPNVLPIIDADIYNGQVVIVNGGASFTRTNINVPFDVAQGMLDNPSGYYFNIHSTLNPTGVARGQLTRTQ